MKAKNDTNNNAIKPMAALEEAEAQTEDTGVRVPVQARRITPPLCCACGKELTVIDKNSDGLLDDGGVAYRMTNILSSAEHNNVMLTGEPGTGKSASVRLLGRRMAEGKIKELSGKRIFEINLDLLFNACYTVSDQGEKLRLLFKEAAENDIILFIDEGHRIYGAGESNSVGNIVKPYITSGSIRLILATTNMEYEMFIARDAALARRFERIRLKEPDAERTAEIIRTVFASRYPDMTIQEGTIKSLVTLTDRYVRDKRYNPDKSLAVLDYAVAWGTNNGAGNEVTDDIVKHALAEKLGIPTERFELNLAQNIREIAGKLEAKFPAWHDSISLLSRKLSDALTRDLRRKGPLCKTAISGSDIALLRDLSYEAAKAMGFSKDEIIRVVPTDSPDELTEPFLVNPNSAIIMEIRVGRQYADTKIMALMTLILREGRVKNAFSDVSYNKAPVFVILEGEEEKGGVIGFEQSGHLKLSKLTPGQDMLMEAWFDGEKPICFVGLNTQEAEELYDRHFLPLLEKQRKRLNAPGVTILEPAKEYIVRQLASPRGWSRASEIAEEIIRMSVLQGCKACIVDNINGEITLTDARTQKNNNVREM